MSNTFAIGDIHGCIKQLVRLISILNLKPDDTIIFMGDYIDRGEDSKSVLDYIVELMGVCNVVALKGNHEDMMQRAFLEVDEDIRGQWIFNWLRNGAKETLVSYGLGTSDCFNDTEVLPVKLKKHLNFINSMPTYHITDTHIFVHATPRPNIEIGEQKEMDLLWRREGRTEQEMGYDHISGKTVISGHTAQENG